MKYLRMNNCRVKDGTDLAAELGYQSYEELIVCRPCNGKLQDTKEIVSDIMLGN